MRKDTARRERFARFLAAGHSVATAASEAGFSPRSSWPAQLAALPEVKARVAALAVETKLTGPDLGPVIERLIAGADAAMAKGTAAAYAAAARMLAEAGRLKQRLPETTASPDFKAWAAQYGPED